MSGPGAIAEIAGAHSSELVEAAIDWMAAKKLWDEVEEIRDALSRD